MVQSLNALLPVIQPCQTMATPVYLQVLPCLTQGNDQITPMPYIKAIHSFECTNVFPYGTVITLINANNHESTCFQDIYRTGNESLIPVVLTVCGNDSAGKSCVSPEYRTVSCCTSNTMPCKELAESSVIDTVTDTERVTIVKVDANDIDSLINCIAQR